MGAATRPQAGGLPAAATASGESLAHAGWFRPPEQQDPHTGPLAPSPRLLAAIDPLVVSSAALAAPLGEGPASLTWFADECLPWLLPLLQRGAERAAADDGDDGGGA